MQQIVQIKVDGELDLHTFKPTELASLVPEYLNACREAGIKTVRIIHGKGTGNLRRSVHSILNRLDIVKSYKIAGHDAGHWGATVVNLK